MLRKLLLVAIGIALISIAPNFETNTHNATAEAVNTSAKVETVAEAPQPTQEPLERAEPQQSSLAPSVPEKAPEPAGIKPTVADNGCGPHDPKLVYDILIEIGVPRLAAIQQVGSWTTESHLNQCQKIGDGGIAWGLNSWHPGRRYDMPAGLREQITWAIHTEMKRDCSSCYAQFMAAESVQSVRSAIKKSTRWGVEGGRWSYADKYQSQL